MCADIYLRRKAVKAEEGLADEKKNVFDVFDRYVGVGIVSLRWGYRG